MRALAAIGCLAALASASACFLAISTADYAGGGDDEGGRDALAADVVAGEAAAPPAKPVAITTVGAVGHATGMAQGAHLLYAKTAATWIFFYYDAAAPSEMRTRLSTDFVTWSDGATLALPYPHGGEPRDFAAAVATLGGVDVVHLGVGLQVPNVADRRHYHGRATIAGGGAIAFGDLDEIAKTPRSDPYMDPDGPAVGIAADGSIEDFTGWSTDQSDGGGGSSNDYGFTAGAPDVGGAFSPTWSSTELLGVSAGCNARGVVPIGGSDFLIVFDKGDVEPEPTNLTWQRVEGLSSKGSGDVFGNGQSTDTNDWALYRVSDDEVHVVRRRDDGTLEHRRYDGNRWHDGPQAPSEALAAGAGLALVDLGGKMTLVGIDATSGDLRATTFDGGDPQGQGQGGSWSSWTTLAAGGGVARRSLIAAGGAGAGRSAVAWSEPATSGAGEQGFVVMAFELE